MGIEPTLSAWKAGVLPLNYTRFQRTEDKPFNCLLPSVFLIWRGEDSNLRRLSRQIYSLIPLTAREPLHKKIAAHSPQVSSSCQQKNAINPEKSRRPKDFMLAKGEIGLFSYKTYTVYNA